METDTIVFTPAALIDLLASIDELRDFDIELTEGLDGNLQLRVGKSSYLIASEDAETVDVPEDVVEDIESINEDAYNELGEDIVIDDGESINAGLLKEALKSLALGGMIRLAGKLIR